MLIPEPSGVRPVLKLAKSGVSPVRKAETSNPWLDVEGAPSIAGLKGPSRSEDDTQLKRLFPSEGEVRAVMPGRLLDTLPLGPDEAVCPDD